MALRGRWHKAQPAQPQCRVWRLPAKAKAAKPLRRLQEEQNFQAKAKEVLTRTPKTLHCCMVL